MRFLISLAVLLLPVVGLSPASAKEVKPLCLRYVSTGERYWIEAQVMYGRELSQAMGGEVPGWLQLNRLYVIVFWRPNQASVIVLGYNVFPIFSGIRGTDLDGREWIVADRDQLQCRRL